MDYRQIPVIQQQVNVAPQGSVSEKYASNDTVSILSGPAPLVLGIVVSVIGIVYIAKSWAGLGIALFGVLVVIVSFLNQK